MEEDSRQKNIHYFMKAAKIVGILAAVLLVLSVCAGGMMFLLLAMALQFYYKSYLRRLGQHGTEYGGKPWKYYGFDY